MRYYEIVFNGPEPIAKKAYTDLSTACDKAVKFYNLKGGNYDVTVNEVKTKEVYKIKRRKA